MTATVMTRLESYRRVGGAVINATDPGFLTEAEIAGRQQVLEYVRFLVDQVPGYADASLARPWRRRSASARRAGSTATHG